MQKDKLYSHFAIVSQNISHLLYEVVLSHRHLGVRLTELVRNSVQPNYGRISLLESWALYLPLPSTISLCSFLASHPVLVNKCPGELKVCLVYLPSFLFMVQAQWHRVQLRGMLHYLKNYSDSTQTLGKGRNGVSCAF